MTVIYSSLVIFTTFSMIMDLTFAQCPTTQSDCEYTADCRWDSYGVCVSAVCDQNCEDCDPKTCESSLADCYRKDGELCFQRTSTPTEYTITHDPIPTPTQTPRFAGPYTTDDYMTSDSIESISRSDSNSGSSSDESISSVSDTGSSSITDDSSDDSDDDSSNSDVTDVSSNSNDDSSDSNDGDSDTDSDDDTSSSSNGSSQSDNYQEIDTNGIESDDLEDEDDDDVDEETDTKSYGNDDDTSVSSDSGSDSSGSNQESSSDDGTDSEDVDERGSRANVQGFYGEGYSEDDVVVKGSDSTRIMSLSVVGVTCFFILMSLVIAGWCFHRKKAMKTEHLAVSDYETDEDEDDETDVDDVDDAEEFVVMVNEHKDTNTMR